MASVPAERIAQVTMQYTSSGNRLSSVMNFGADSSVIAGELDDLLASFESIVVPKFQDAMSQEIKIEALIAHGVKAAQMRPATRYLSGIVGLIAQESLPANTAAVIQLLQTEVSGRHNGRIFMSGVPETKTLDGRLTDDYISTELDAVAAALTTPLTPTGKIWKLCVVQRFQENIAIVPVGWNVTRYRILNNLGTQRRRTTELREFHP